MHPDENTPTALLYAPVDEDTRARLRAERFDRRLRDAPKVEMKSEVDGPLPRSAHNLQVVTRGDENTPMVLTGLLIEADRVMETSRTVYPLALLRQIEAEFASGAGPAFGGWVSGFPAVEKLTHRILRLFVVGPDNLVTVSPGIPGLYASIEVLNTPAGRELQAWVQHHCASDENGLEFAPLGLWPSGYTSSSHRLRGQVSEDYKLMGVELECLNPLDRPRAALEERDEERMEKSLDLAFNGTGWEVSRQEEVEAQMPEIPMAAGSHALYRTALTVMRQMRAYLGEKEATFECLEQVTRFWNSTQIQRLPTPALDLLFAVSLRDMVRDSQQAEAAGGWDPFELSRPQPFLDPMEQEPTVRLAARWA